MGVLSRLFFENTPRHSKPVINRNQPRLRYRFHHSSFALAKVGKPFIKESSACFTTQSKQLGFGSLRGSQSPNLVMPLLFKCFFKGVPSLSSSFIRSMASQRLRAQFAQ